jgi:hypothetical protein
MTMGMQFIPVLISSSFLMIPIGIILLIRHRERKLKRSPLSKHLLRGPGHSLRCEIDDRMWDVAGYLMVLPLLPLTLYSIHVTRAYMDGSPLRFSIILVVGGLIALMIVSYKLFSEFRKIWRLRLGYEAEVAMGQELDQLMRNGAIVFHDFPADGFNIDHVVITTNGVFAIETKGRSKLIRGRGKSNATLTFDGKLLKFPTWSEKHPLEQVRSQAVWLSKWLSNKLKEEISVKPVLAFPGWFIELKGKNDVAVINGSQVNWILKIKHDQLSEKLASQIAQQIEDRCRDVKPSMAIKKGSIAG